MKYYIDFSRNAALPQGGHDYKHAELVIELPECEHALNNREQRDFARMLHRDVLAAFVTWGGD